LTGFSLPCGPDATPGEKIKSNGFQKRTKELGISGNIREEQGTLKNRDISAAISKG
jgi:hypothetical protein